MFPGEGQAVIYFADTGKRRGTLCAFRQSMLWELEDVLGEKNVIIK